MGSWRSSTVLMMSVTFALIWFAGLLLVTAILQPETIPGMWATFVASACAALVSAGLALMHQDAVERRAREHAAKDRKARLLHALDNVLKSLLENHKAIESLQETFARGGTPVTTVLEHSVWEMNQWELAQHSEDAGLRTGLSRYFGNVRKLDADIHGLGQLKWGSGPKSPTADEAMEALTTSIVERMAALERIAHETWTHSQDFFVAQAWTSREAVERGRMQGWMQALEEYLARSGATGVPRFGESTPPPIDKPLPSQNSRQQPEPVAR